MKIYRQQNSLVGIIKNPIQEIYPLDSEIDVYYDSNNPKLSYVLRYCNKKWIFWLTFITGITLILLDIAILLLL